MNKDIIDKIIETFPGSSHTYRKGTVLTQAHKDPRGVMLLLEGVVEEYDITPEGNKMTLNVFKPHAFFPMSWAINKTPNEYFFAAMSDVTIRYAPPEVVVAFLYDNPEVAFDLLSRVYRGTDALLKRLSLASAGVASHRLIFELLVEAYRFGTDAPNNKKHIKVRQSTLAARSGLARETVSRELHKMAVDRLLTMTKGGLVLDLERLKERLL